MTHSREPTCPHCALPAAHCTPIDAYHDLARRLDLRPEAPSGIEPGWVPLLEHLVVDLRNAGWHGQPAQIKQKLGTLRFYAAGLDERQAELVEAAVDQSGVTCEGCGASGASAASTGWVRVMCIDCATKPT